MSRQAWMSLLGLYTYDNTLFDKMSFPDEFTEDDIDLFIDNLLMECAELEVLFTDPDFMKNAIGVWSAKEVYVWNRLYEAVTADYDPIENYNRHEETDDQNRGTVTHGGTDSTTGSGNDTLENSITSFNNNTYAPHDKAVMGKGTTEATTYGHTVTDATGHKVTSHIHGNIGVTTSQQMLESELDIRPKLNIFNIMIESFRQRFCLLVY